MEGQNTVQKKEWDPFSNASIDPKQLGIASVLLAIGALFVFGEYLSLGAFSCGIIGSYSATKKKAGMGIIILNILGSIIGITLYILGKLS